jgi:monofunctional biosynthetic peptidoglycan transglycosylase
MNEEEPRIGPEPAADVAAPAPPPAPAPAVAGPAPPPDPIVAPTPAPPRKRGRWLKRLFVLALVVFVIAPVGLTGVYRFLPPPVTYLMVQRLFQGYGLHKSWRPISAIAPSLSQAVIAGEDAQFCQHHGFDFEAMQKAFAANEKRPNRIRGGSTISQQTAKNVFLWPGRDYVRKGFEAYFTVLIEALWGKKRILEVYLNVVELGPGVYGAEAAAQRYFHVPAATLTSAQSARLTAILPSPLRWKPVASGPYVARRSQKIGAAAVTVREDDLAACVRR